MTAIFKSINFKGDLFATGWTFGAQGVIKLCSSLILTRILRPEAYGVITVLMSILFVIEMIGDLGLNLFVIRDEQGEEPRYLNTAWSIRLLRCAFNTSIVLIGANWIAELYKTPELATPLRVLSFGFVIGGLYSMSFPIAIRRKRARIIVYSELAATFVAAVFSILYCYYSRDFWGIVYGSLLTSIIQMVMSYQFFKELRPKFHIDLQAAKEVLRFTRYTTPSSLLTLALSQFDKIIFVRLFDLRLLGLYGLAGNIAGPLEALISKISQMVLYPRCTEEFRRGKATFAQNYYHSNVRLFVCILILPPLLGGSAHAIFALLYPSRYSGAEDVFHAFMVRAALLSLACPSEDLLIAAGESQVILVGNILRAAWTIAGSLLGYYYFGFIGFVYGMGFSGLPPLIYYLYLQRKRGYLIARYETYKVLFVVTTAAFSYALSRLIWMFLSPHLHFLASH